MAGRHRKPPKFQAARHYIGWAFFWLLLVALFVLSFFILKEMFS